MTKFSAYIIRIACVLFLFTACRSGRDKEMEQIKALKHAFDATAVTHPDMAQAQKLDAAYKEFIVHYPKDSAVPALLYNDALLNNAPLDKPDQSIMQLRQLITSYPESKYAPQSLLLLGFLYEVRMKDQKHAIESYQMLVDKYPNHPLAGDARLSIENMGKDWNSLFHEKKDSVR